MSEKKGSILNASARDGVQYRTASKLAMVFGCAVNGSGMCFYLLMLYASYIANVGYGIGLVLAGMIITGSRIFDGVTDPIVAAIFDRMKAGKHGKIRAFILTGWAVMAVADVCMFNLLSEKFTGAAGIIVFIALYMVHIIGYTILNMSSSVIAVVLTNDPIQRPFLNLAGTIYSYCIPMILSTILSFAILPRYGNQYNAACLREACFWYLGFALFLVLLACVGVSRIDNAEVLGGVNTEGKGSEKVGFKEIWSLLKDNKPFRMWVITGATDKLAQSTGGQSIVSVMMSGILIGSYQATTLMSNFTMVVSIGFAFVGGVYIAKYGAKMATTVWSAACIILSVITVVFCVVLGPDGMSAIGVMGPAMIIYVILTIAKTGASMILSTAAGTMKADVTDYELERSGNYLPGVVGGAYSFIDKVMSSISSTIAALCVAMIGYTTVAPQMGDEPTWPILIMTMFLSFGLPILGWLCNVLAMRGYELSKERMVEVQKNVAALKKA